MCQNITCDVLTPSLGCRRFEHVQPKSNAAARFWQAGAAGSIGLGQEIPMTTSIPLVIAPRRLGRVAGLMVVLWTLALAASVVWNARLMRKTMLQVATQEARTSCNKDLHYLLNPAYMTRQVHAMKAQEDDVIGHNTSLKPMRPENAPDAWEAAALRACQSGQTEVVSRELLHGRRFLRYLKPLVTTASCLKCHTNQGYKAGEPNGGISVAVPLDPYLALAQAELWPMGEVHIGLWVLGVLGIGLGARQMRQRLDQQLQAAAALRESEDRFRTVADFTVAMEYWRLPDGSLAYMSPSCERLTGYSAAEFLQAPELLASIVHSEDRPRVKGHFSDASETRAGPEQRELEFRIRTRSGETRWIGHVCQPVVDREGKFQGIRVSNRDLTDRKQVAEVLRTSEAKHRLLFESAGDAIFIHDEAGRILAVNPSACERLGYTHAELMAIMISQVDSPAEAPHAPERIARLMAQGQLTFETAHQRKDGSSVWTEVSARRITWDGQSAMMSICRDITERKRTAVALRAAALYARNLIETSLDPLVTISAEGKVTDVNAATEKITGASREKLIGSDFADYFTEPERARAGYLKVFAQGQVIDYPLALRHSSGAITNVLYNAAVYRNEQGEVLGVFAAARDVTARQQAEAALRSREERLSFLLSSTPVVIYTCRATGDFGATFLSENVPSLLGHRAIDFVEDPTFWVQHIHPADVQRVFAGLSTLSVQDSHTHEYRLRHQDGTYRWMHDQVRVVRDAAGHPTMLIGSWLDITERKQAETALRESETNLNRAQAIAHIGSWSLDVARDILDWSAETRRIFGVAPETPLTYRSFLTCLHPDDQARVDRAWQAALPGTPYDIEHRIIVENQVKWVRERAELEAGADGNVRRGLGTVQDITERKLAEAALQESEEKYRVLVETTNTGFLILNNEGKVIDANAEYVRLTGHSELGDILGKTVIEWTADYDQQRNAAAVAQCVKVGFVKNFVTDYVDGNGRITPIEVNAAIIGTGESMRIVSLCRDITERKQAAEELRRSEERYRSILNATPDAVAIMDTAGRVVMISPGTVAMFGYQRAEELLGKWVTDFIVPEERARGAQCRSDLPRPVSRPNGIPLFAGRRQPLRRGGQRGGHPGRRRATRPDGCHRARHH